MSRICVKNLPKYVAEDRLREFFSAKGEVTDAKLMRTKDGTSRQFAFIGFRTVEEAEEAIKYFNKSYLDTFRINCEIARKVGDPEMPRPWSRHSVKQVKHGEKDGELGGGNVKDEKKKINNKKGNDEENGEPGLQEFLQVMQPRGKSKLWADDTVVAPPTGGNMKIGEKGVHQKVEGEEKVVSENVENSNDGGEDEKVNDVARSGVASFEDYFKSRVKTDWTDSENESSENDDDDDENEEDEEGNSRKENIQGVGLAQPTAKEEVHPEDSNGEIVDPESLPFPASKDDNDEILDTGRLFIRNLPYTATEDELEEHFLQFGKVSQVHLVIDKDTKRSKGFAYVHYELPESASRALEELDNTTFQGRLLHVMLAKQKIQSNKQETNLPPGHGPKTFKQRREEERKAAEASGDTRAWNSLFMRPDTIVENIARRHGVSKSDLLDREANDLAVRVALGETQVIAETKKALSNAGVNVSSLEEIATGKADGIKRSNRVLLVKNLPYGSSEGELADMFRKFGSLDKIILPPTKTLALIAFLEPSEARAAFKGLAYRQYKHVPLYLEWAPANVLSQSSTSNIEDEKSAAVGEHEVTRAMLEQSVAGISEADLDPDRIESRSLFVKNLNFKTPDESLKKHLVGHMKEGKVLSVRIKKHVKHGKNVSMGFGFVEFDTLETATNVCRDLQGTVLDGHALILQLCHAKKDEQAVKKVDKDRSSTKLLVRNVAFEATEKDLRQLFSPFGQIKSLRLPMKFGNHRGFAFVEFLSKQEAQNALEALSNTHLYGRHLVLERAKEGESLEELRARTAAQFTDEQNGHQNPTKLSKKRKNMAVLDEESMKFQRYAD